MHDPKSNLYAIFSSFLPLRLATSAKTAGMLAAVFAFLLSGSATKDHSTSSYLSDSAIQQAFYVSPQGSDSGPGTLENPLQTIQAARDRAAAYLSSNPSSDGSVVVYLREGIYQQCLASDGTKTIRIDRWPV
jgi:hypothetical protein